MNMAVTRFALWLLTRANAPGTREALVGDLMEEIARGRSALWVCQELTGLYGRALIAHARKTVRVTPPLVALALGVVMLGGASIASLEKVVETWASVYYVAGTMSLFAHVMSRTTASRTLPLTEEADRH
jgi:hypothetical protein